MRLFPDWCAADVSKPLLTIADDTDSQPRLEHLVASVTVPKLTVILQPIDVTEGIWRLRTVLRMM